MRCRPSLIVFLLTLWGGAVAAVPLVPVPRLQQPTVELRLATGAEELYQTGLKQLREQEYPTALLTLDRAISLDSTLAKAYDARASARCHLGDKQGAIEDYLRAAALHESAGMAAEALRSREAASFVGRDYSLALEQINRALTLEPAKAVLYRDRGQIRQVLGDREGALADYAQARALAPDDANLHRSIGLLRTCLGDTEGAIADFTHALAVDPQLAIVYHHRAMLLLGRGERQAASADLEKAAQLFEQEGNTDRAEYERAQIRHIEGNSLFSGLACG